MKAARLALAAIVTLGAGCTVTDRAPFHLQESTVASVHAALARGEITCTKLTQLYLERIEAYNLRGPTLRAILAVNPNAMKIAADMDRRYGDGASARGPLHCIPVILKDNFNTFDMPTSAGHVAMKDSVPPADAFSVDRMRKAGALILAKANLQELARGGMSKSSLGGQVLNPYRSHAHARWFERRHGCGHRVEYGRTGYRQRYRAVDPFSGIGEQSGRHSSDARTGEPCRRRSEQPHTRRDRPDYALRDGRGAAAERDGRL